MATSTSTTTSTSTSSRRRVYQPPSLLQITRDRPEFLRAITQVDAETRLPFNLVYEERCKNIRLVIKFDMVECFEDALKELLMDNFVGIERPSEDIPMSVINKVLDYINDIVATIPSTSVRILDYIQERLPQLVASDNYTRPVGDNRTTTTRQFGEDVWAYFSYEYLAKMYFDRLLDVGLTDVPNALMDNAVAAATDLDNFWSATNASEYNSIYRHVRPLDWMAKWAIVAGSTNMLQLAVDYNGGQLRNANSLMNYFHIMLMDARIPMRNAREDYANIGAMLEAALSQEERDRHARSVRDNPRAYQTWQQLLAKRFPIRLLT